MFEKEAEEYVIEKHNIDITKQPVDFALRCEFAEDFTDFQKGAEFGYNKANEWHDLRKNPNDLPCECKIVLCYCLGYCGVSFPITARLYIDYEDSSVYRWWTIAGEGHSEQLHNVIAWKEIVLPKESE